MGKIAWIFRKITMKMSKKSREFWSKIAVLFQFWSEIVNLRWKNVIFIKNDIFFAWNLPGINFEGWISWKNIIFALISMIIWNNFHVFHQKWQFRSSLRFCQELSSAQKGEFHEKRSFLLRFDWKIVNFIPHQKW